MIRYRDRAALLALAAVLLGCSRIPDCDADVTLATLGAQIKVQVDERFRGRLREAAIAPGTIELNPRKLAEAARTDPVRVQFEDLQMQTKDTSSAQCRTKVMVKIDLHDRLQPLEVSGTLRYSVTEDKPGFRVQVDSADVVGLLK